ncbi:MAG: protoporphyrinogen/coproporphyrinogen oxidase [Pyrinomonadaceae bacterium]
MSGKPEVLVVGAGLAGLTCAWHLHRAGIPFHILEASSSVGGRVQTDEVDGFLFDRGFQVLLTAYPEAQDLLDYEPLSLGEFYSGSLVRVADRFHRIADPFRHPIDSVPSLLSPVGTFVDKLRVARLRQRVLAGEVDDIFKRPERRTIDALKSDGFSDSIIDTFFRPFLGGVFLDPDLQTTSRMFEFVFRMFSLGKAALPGNGMRAIPEQVLSLLPSGSVSLNSAVKTIDGAKVILASGERLTADVVVVATDGPAAAKLLGFPAPRTSSVACLYFAADHPPVNEPVLVLNGNGDGPVNNLCVPSLVNSSYALPGATLISATVLRPDQYRSAPLELAVREQLDEWFDGRVSKWQHLKTYWIENALPQQLSLSLMGQQVAQGPGLYLCGDHTDTASINGAMSSGRRTAQTVIRDLTGFRGEPPTYTATHAQHA